MDIDLRLDKYDFHYQFRENPGRYDCAYHPERIIVRNEALRTNDTELYERYLKATFPTKVEEELSQFAKVLSSLQQATGTEARAVFNEKGIWILRSDIHWEEKDAIFTVRNIPELDNSFLISEDDDEQLLFNHVYPDWVTDRSALWIDWSELS